MPCSKYVQILPTSSHLCCYCSGLCLQHPLPGRLQSPPHWSPASHRGVFSQWRPLRVILLLLRGLRPSTAPPLPSHSPGSARQAFQCPAKLHGGPSPPHCPLHSGSPTSRSCCNHVSITWGSCAGLPSALCPLPARFFAQIPAQTISPPSNLC